MQTSPIPLIGESAPVRDLRSLISTISASSSTVLITGESGTGKELVAQALHNEGPRAAGNFVPINCGAIPRELIESELFGHRRGAFTGAVADRVGRFELAHGGTIFLDEIGDLPLDMQVKLLRVLQERSIQPVGSMRAVAIDVRVVAATHKNLETEVAAGRFREDLYYRLNVLPLHTTSLRERADDIPELLTFYSRRHAQAGQHPIEFAPSLLAMLKRYAWPGNVRELSNLVDRFSTLYPGQRLQLNSIAASMLPKGLADLMHSMPKVVTSATVSAPAAGNTSRSSPASVACEAHDISLQALLGLEQTDPQAPGVPEAAPAPAMVMPMHSPHEPVLANAQGLMNEAFVNEAGPGSETNVEEIICMAQGTEMLPPEGLSLKQRMIDIERSFIEQALARTRGNVSQTARLLSLQRTTLIEKINKYSLRLS
jgi:sigma-54 dependent transcriptional regulator, flagellar regulatory protein